MPDIVVIGARGRLGVEITNAAASAGAAVAAVASSPSAAWRPEVAHQRFAADEPVSDLGGLFEHADAVVVAAPLDGCEVHELALECGCHVIDVTIDSEQVRSILSLSENATNAGRAVVAAAGLAPGLTGLLGRALLEQEEDHASVEVCLTQSANGTAGEAGTREMLEMLTRHGSSETCHLPTGEAWRPEHARAFRLPTAETMLENTATIRYFTRFDRERLNRTIRFLARIRKAIPSLYASLRDSTARRKAAAEKPATEPIFLSAVAINVAGDPVAWRSLKLTSDYGATAAVAVGTALAASGGQLPPGAGMLAQVTDLAAVLSYDTLQDVIIAREASDSFNATGQ